MTQYKGLEIVKRIKVDGSSRNWEVCELADGSYTCNCPAWIFHRGQKVDCKHIKELKFKQEHLSVTVSGLSKDDIDLLKKTTCYYDNPAYSYDEVKDETKQ